MEYNEFELRRVVVAQALEIQQLKEGHEYFKKDLKETLKKMREENASLKAELENLKSEPQPIRPY